MQKSYSNCYKNARVAAGYTQERWAEMLGISDSSVRQYETGLVLPSDETVAAMAEISGCHIVCYQHLKNKSAIANDLLPEVKAKDPAHCAISLLLAIKALEPQLDALLAICQDGLISSDEEETFASILDVLSDVVSAAWSLKYAKRGDDT